MQQHHQYADGQPQEEDDTHFLVVHGQRGRCGAGVMLLLLSQDAVVVAASKIMVLHGRWCCLLLLLSQVHYVK